MKIWRWLKAEIFPRRPCQLFLQTLDKWRRDECLEWGAALAYYALFSLFPLCLIMLGIIGFLLGPETNVYGQLLTLARNALPQESYGLVEETLKNLNQSSVGAGVLGFGLWALSASKVFEALDRCVDRIWGVYPPEATAKKAIQETLAQTLKKKILAFLMVLSSVLVLLLSMLSSLALKILMALWTQMQTTLTGAAPWLKIDQLLVARSLQTSLSYLLMTTVILALLKILPSTALRWRDVLPGAFFISALLLGLQNLVSGGLISLGSQFQAYGLVGNVMVLMLWIFLIFQIFFLGCEFTYVYTHLYGSRRR
ncbi:MAG: ribonuclease BN [Cyanobacteria bacterium RI_101]|nr:ribonuclease BN [Cyanobacteria bacterium RI_101]